MRTNPSKNKTVVLDLETKKGFDAIEWDRSRLKDLEVSVVGIYRYETDEFLIFKESQLKDLGKILRKATKVIGFNLFNFDYPVLSPYVSFDLFQLPTIDILQDVKKAVGHRVSLDSLAIATLNTQKTGDGLLAIKLYEQGKMAALKNYCLEDVKITRDLYEYGFNHGVLHFTSRSGWERYAVAVCWDTDQKRETIEDLVEKAFLQKRQLQIEYISLTVQGNEDFRKTRKIEILSIDKPYIEAFCHLRKEKRNFRIDRILKAKILEKKY